MFSRKDIKRNARRHLKRSYLLLVVVCAISIFLGTEFTSVVSDAQTWYDTLTGRITQVDAEGLRGSVNNYGDKVLEDLIADNLSAGREQAAGRMRALREASDAGSVLGRSRGVLAAVMNSVNSGHFYVTLGTALHSVLHSGEAAAILMILGSVLLQALAWIFIKDMYRAVMRRVFLETRVYSQYPINHLLHFKTVRRWGRASFTLLRAAVYEALWSLTIVGGFIKRYSYFLVPFIAAENPDIPSREAITLSRRMMDGHKWECFKLDLSFLGWKLLGYVTFGAVSVLWGTPYCMAAYTEYYARLRQAAREQALPGSEKLNDACLFEKADPGALRTLYADIAEREDLIEGAIIDLTPAQRFFARNFGIWLGSLIDKQVYSHQQSLRHQARVGRLEMSGEAYPQRMNPLWNRRSAALTGRVGFITPCTVWSLIVVFFSFCLIGWLWEVSLHLITSGVFVNRGALHGPWLPIYGGGVVMIAVLLYRFRSRPALEALAIVVLCGLVEYMTSYFMELSRGMRWWDYTGYFLNLNGRICGEGLAVFAAGGMAAVYLLVPIIDGMVVRVRPKLLVPVCLALLACFSADLVYSHFVPNVGAGITDYEDARAPAEETAAGQAP